MRRLDGNFEYVNDEFYELTGLAPGSLEGGDWLQAIHPDDIDGVRAAWNRIIQSGADDASEFRLRMADGSYRRLAGRLTCIEDQRGKIIKWVGALAESSVAH